MAYGPWQKIKELVVYDGKYRKVKLARFTHPDGSIGEYEIIEQQGEVAIMFPVTREGKILLVRQFRPGPEQYFLELPGGFIEPGETREAAAARELIMETGYTGNLRYVTALYNGAYEVGHMHLFVVEDAHYVQAPEFETGEYLKNVLMSVDEFKTMLKGEGLKSFDMAGGYRALDFLKLL